MLPEILLDDVRFQELVSEARTRIVRHAPEWTEHNVSDPGHHAHRAATRGSPSCSSTASTGSRSGCTSGCSRSWASSPGPPECASVAVRFMLDRPGGGAVVPAGTEVAVAAHRRQRVRGVPDRRRAGGAARVQARHLRHPAQGRQDPAGQGRRRGAGPDELQAPFGSPASAGDALLLGFDSPIAGLVIRLEHRVVARRGIGEPGRPAAAVGGVGGRRRVGAGDRRRRRDRRLHLRRRRDHRAGARGGGRDADRGRQPPLAALPRARPRAVSDHGVYTTSPEITLRAGAGRGRARSRPITPPPSTGELLGTSEGIPGATYPLPRRPVLAPEEGEVVEVRELGSDEWVAVGAGRVV